MKAYAQKNTHLQAAQSQAQTKACKRVFFSATQGKLFLEIPPLQKIKNTQPHRPARQISGQ